MKLNIKGTETTPEIALDLENKFLKIKGHSTPENTIDFYAPIILNVLKFYNEGNRGFQIHIELEYFNTSTSKALYDLFEIVESHEDQTASIHWYTESDDQEIKDAGTYFQKMFNLVNFIVKEI
jgi:hypothetical protein